MTEFVIKYVSMYTDNTRRQHW